MLIYLGDLKLTFLSLISLGDTMVVIFVFRAFQVPFAKVLPELGAYLEGSLHFPFS